MTCFSQDIASCCVSTKEEGRCTGSASCKVCKNCSRCAHCGAGHSCGVCADMEEPEESQKTTRKNTTPRATTNKPRTPSANNDPDLSPAAQFEAISEINLRSGPGENFGIVEKLRKGAKMIKLTERGSWTKVQVVSSGKTGYVLSKYIR